MFSARSYYIFKVDKPLYGVRQAGNHRFITYYIYYSNKLGMSLFIDNLCLFYKSDVLGIVGSQTSNTLSVAETHLRMPKKMQSNQ